MKTLLGMNIIKSSKNDKKFMMLHLVDDLFMDSADHSSQVKLLDSPEKTGWGQSVSTEFIDLARVGSDIEIQGDLVPGAAIRIFKENINGMDQITLIQVLGKRK